MSNIRAGPMSLSDPDDDYSFQILKGDVERLRLALDKVGITSGTPLGSTVNGGGDGAGTTNVINVINQISLGSLRLITLSVCVDGVTKTMTVLGTTPA